ncbi:MAG TPA: response regulator transcription factor [Candidatus Dormibacteraeota bacterium]|nr:response regulator transcription factor [Candidatus Dormibacteraeota bacterium]
MRVLVVEDERKVASFVARSLRERTCAVDIVTTGRQAIESAQTAEYDLILLDLRLPDIDGLEVCRRLRQSGMETPILMLTARGLVEERVRGLDAGADDYLVKPFALAELHARIRALSRRGLNRGVTLRFADLTLDRRRRSVERGGQAITLTQKEFALLEFLLLRVPETVTRSEIVEHVWDSTFDSGSNLVEVYMNRLRQKVDHGYGVKLLHTVRGVGYRLGLES